MSLLQNSNAISSGGYDINNSLRFRSSATAYLSRTPAVAGNRKTWTWSAWVKRGNLSSEINILFSASSSASNANRFIFYFDSVSPNVLLVSNSISGASTNIRVTTQVFRDPSAWYHIVFAFDTTQAVAADRIKIYINGSQITSFSASADLALNYDGFVNGAWQHRFGNGWGTSYTDLYIAENYFIDGQALTPSSFGETDPVTGSWVAKKYTGTYGTNGFYLPFSDTLSNENRFLYSEDFANAAWTKGSSTVTSNSVVAPNGTTTADTFTDNTTTDQHLIVQSVPVMVGSQYTVSIYAKANTRSQIGLAMHGESFAVFDLSAGTVIGTGGYSNYGIQSVGNGWYRCYVTITKTNDNGNINYIIFKDGVNPYLGTGTGSIYIWGAQVTYGSTLTKYIPTTTAAVTNQGTIENLLTYSEDLTNAAWGKAQVSVTGNTINAPNGATTADTIYEVAAAGEHYLDRSITPVTNTQYVFSAYVKYLNRQYLGFRVVYQNGAQDTIPVFDIQNGTYFITQGSAPAAYSITSAGNGWYRISITFITPATNPFSTLLFRFQSADDLGNTSYTGNASKGYYLWGVQLETQGTLGPYLPTVASAQSLINRIGTDRSLGDTGFGYNTWIPNNISLTLGTTYDAMTDSPTLTSETVANYCVGNPLLSSSSVTFSNANLKVACGGGAGVYRTGGATFGVSSGKYYWEFLFDNTGGNALGGVGNITQSKSTWESDTTVNSNFWYINAFNGNKSNGGASISYGSSFTTSDICMVAIDMDNGKIWWGKNGTWFASGDPAAGTNAAYTNLSGFTLTAAFMGGSGAGFTNQYSMNFGQRPFSYTPPTGFKRLNTYNLPTPTILNGRSYMDATLYIGNGVTGRAVNTPNNFRPDFAWGRARNVAGGSNILIDTNRGNTKYLISESTAAEGTAVDLTFTNTGVTWNSGPSLNGNGFSYVNWFWQAGQGTNTSNTSGSITSTVSVNTTAGFSIVTYTGNGTNGATVGHGLGVAPRVIILKSRSIVENWAGYFAALGNGFTVNLNSTAAASGTSDWNSTSPTSTVFTLGNGSGINQNTTTYVAYCWAEIAGFSRFGSYTGNGSADGPFVYTGFRPKFVMLKRTDTAGFGWCIKDSSRSPSNEVIADLFPNTSDAEYTIAGQLNTDFLSNGFKLRQTNANQNANGGTYIFMAFAENPFKNSNAR